MGEVKPLGIDIKLFKQKTDFDERMKGLNSGRELKLRFSQHKISITDVLDPQFFFEAYSEKNFVSFVVRTRGYENDPQKRHPDLFAKKLVELSIQYFEQFRSITVFIAEWNDKKDARGNTLEDNFNQFNTNLKEMGLEVDLDKAIFNTWTGRLAWNLGFKEITEVYKNPDSSYEIHFEKTATEQIP